MKDALAAIVLALLASAWMTRTAGVAVSSLDARHLSVLAGLSIAYLASRVLLRWRDERSLLVRGVEAVVSTVAFVAGAIVWLGLRNYALSKQTIALSLASAVVLAAVAEVLRGRPVLYGAWLALLCALGLAWNLAVIGGAFEDEAAHLAPRFIDSQHYGIEARFLPLPGLLKPGGGIPIPPRGYRVEPGGGIREGGGIVARGDGYLLVSGAGDFYWIDEPRAGHDLVVRELDIDAPINAAEFEQAMKGDPGVRYWNFRVQDVEVVDRPDGMQVFVSHHYWHRDRGCYVVRLSTFTSRVKDIRQVTAPVSWRTVFESTPCLPIKRFPRGQRFAGEESGGRLARLDDDTLLLTLGDHEFDGLNSETALAQDMSASYGKIIAISLADETASFHSIGHRNPQGLFVGADGSVWSTEHGPEGGDELNRIEAGNNYGWPYATYGVDYGLNTWPLTKQPGSHDGYAQPVYAWVPSIGVSNLVGVDSDLFPIWKGDLLVASLRNRGLWRMRIRNGGLVVDERIEIGVRMRDIIEGNHGQIVIWSDEGPELVFLTPTGDRSTPQSAFAVCRSCHPVEGSKAAIGPNLAGVVGRKIASVPDYPYSSALSSLDGSWDAESLDAFLTSPQTFAPGTSMPFPGIQDAAERQRVIHYLQGL